MIRFTISVRLRRRQLIETIKALEAVNLAACEVAAVESITSAIVLFRRALATLQERTR